MKTRPDYISYGAVGTLGIVWGSVFALTDVALRGFGAVEVVAARAGLAAMVLVCVRPDIQRVEAASNAG